MPGHGLGNARDSELAAVLVLVDLCRHAASYDRGYCSDRGSRSRALLLATSGEQVE